MKISDLAQFDRQVLVALAKVERGDAPYIASALGLPSHQIHMPDVRRSLKALVSTKLATIERDRYGEIYVYASPTGIAVAAGGGIPDAYATPVPGRENWLWSVPSCPLCGQEHQHGGGPLSGDPQSMLGHRLEHCATSYRFLEDNKGYNLVDPRAPGGVFASEEENPALPTRGRLALMTAARLEQFGRHLHNVDIGAEVLRFEGREMLREIYLMRDLLLDRYELRTAEGAE